MCIVCCLVYLFFFKHKTAYEMRMSDWSSDVCSSDLIGRGHALPRHRGAPFGESLRLVQPIILGDHIRLVDARIADRERAPFILHDRPVDRTINGERTRVV